MKDETMSVSFADLLLPKELLSALEESGYTEPSPIQAGVIPKMLSGRDILGQAQTGTGKTAAFALPLLAKLDIKQKTPQVLVLAPTRELAMQVSAAFTRYGANLSGLRVLPIYGGGEYREQLQQLKRGVHVVVGTPGRVIDHMRRGTFDVSGLKAIVLDEADEMLRMGFIEDVKWVLEQIPADSQRALFSATMPRDIRRIADEHLSDAEEVAIRSKTATVTTTRQRYWMVQGATKLDGLMRILEEKASEGALVFVRTKISSAEVADKLIASGFKALALNGDIAQKQRELAIEKIKNGKVDILVATDVAARGLDVERISHVINYDMPQDTESYIHRIGRTGRAGRVGSAILFVTPREGRMLKNIERATRQPIERMDLPSVESINKLRAESFKKRIQDTMTRGRLEQYAAIATELLGEENVSPVEFAAALMRMAHGDKPLFLTEDSGHTRKRDAFPRENRERDMQRTGGGRPWERRRSDDFPRGEGYRGKGRAPRRRDERMARA